MAAGSYLKSLFAACWSYSRKPLGTSFDPRVWSAEPGVPADTSGIYCIWLVELQERRLQCLKGSRLAQPGRACIHKRASPPPHRGDGLVFQTLRIPG